MKASSDEMIYEIPSFSKDRIDLKHVDGPTHAFESFTCDMYIAPDALQPEPDKFKIEWEMESPHTLNIELLRIVILPNPKTSTTGRYIIGFEKPLVLEGAKGSISFLNQMSTETFRLCSECKGWSSSLRFHFRSRNENLMGATHSNRDVSAGIQQYATNDVAFVFPSPSSEKPSRMLWARSSLLRKESPYFDTLLSSEGFIESRTSKAPLLTYQGYSASDSNSDAITVTKGPGERDKEEALVGFDENAPIINAKASRPDVELECEDSDLEDDSFPSPSLSPPIRHIVMKGTAYKTLYSFLYYLETGTIRFSTLSSLLRDVPQTSSSSRSTNRTSSSASSFPPTCSPKSMYLLSHLYEHSTLRQLSYESISSQLGSNNALNEYFSDLSSLYPEIKRITMKSVLDNWEIVKDSKEMKQIQQDLERGKLESSKVGLLFELFRKLKPV